MLCSTVLKTYIVDESKRSHDPTPVACQFVLCAVYLLRIVRRA